jgi:phenylalanyl-tRNA synthetase beta chain
LKAEIPSWRSDLKIPEDLNEEIARLWGYDRCPITLPPLPREELRDDWATHEDPAFVRKESMRARLAAAGYQEILSYSLVHPDDHPKIGFAPELLIELWNPLSREYSVMRNTLLIGALQTVSRNLNRKAAAAFKLFEIGSIYHRSAEKEFTPDQPERLGLLVAGTPPQSWGQPAKPMELLHLKGAIRQLFAAAGIAVSESVRENEKSFYSGPVVSFESESGSFGLAGQISPSVAARYEIPDEVAVYYAELDLEKICSIKPQDHRLKPIPKVAPVLRDLAVLIPEEISYAQLSEAIVSAGKPLLESAELFDLYKGKQVPAGKKSAAFRLAYAAGDRTLTEEEVQASHQKIVQTLADKFQAMLR